MLSLLSHLFVTERHRAKASAMVGHSTPYLSEFDVDNRDIEPLLATNMRGDFIRTRVARAGHVRFGYTELDWTKESALIAALHAAIVRNAEEEGWGNVVGTVDAAIERMVQTDFVPRLVLVASKEGLTVPESLVVVECEIPAGMALVAAHPLQTGLYTRIRNHVGVLAQNVDQSLTAVVP